MFLAGPGVLVPVLKRTFERPRPAEVTRFGGGETFARPLEPGPGCADGCASFPSGDAAIGYSFLALGVATRSPGLVAGAVVLGTGLGAVRVAQGRHFPRDVVFAALLVTALTAILHRLVVGPGF